MGTLNAALHRITKSNCVFQPGFENYKKKENFCFIYRKIEFLTFFFTFLQEKANEFERHLDTFVKRLDNGTLS